MTKTKRRTQRGYINIGTIVFLLIIVYLAGNLLRFMSRNKRAVYEVSQSAISDTIKGTGIILREEKVVTTKEDGYVNSYLPDGDRVKTNGIVYTLDRTGKIQEEINTILADKNQAGSQEKKEIYEDLRTFVDGYKDDDFYYVSDTKNELTHDLLSYTGSLLAENKKALEKKYGKDCYVEVRSKISGLVSYSSDGLEDLKADQVTKKVFDDKARMKDLRSKDKTKAGTPVYRITSSQDWKLIVPLSQEDYARMLYLKDKNEEHNRANIVQITIEKDEFQVSVPFDCYERNKQGYLELSFHNYVQRYLNQRYLSIELLLVQGSGLKIPASSLVEKEVFRIPTDYLSKGSNSDSSNHVNLLYKDKKGRAKIKQVPVKVFDEENDMSIIFSRELSEGDHICQVFEETVEGNSGDSQSGEADAGNKDTSGSYSLDKTTVAYGVYSVNAGYAIFCYVDITERNEDYCIINAEKSKIRLYDRIILNSDSIRENEIIY